MHKKCTVLQNFMSYISTSQPLNLVVPQATELSTTHVFKYLISDEAITFRLNNGVVQVRANKPLYCFYSLLKHFIV